VLFATYSCVDNTESDSVANLRNAKADELKANAQALKDHATAALTAAEGEAALNKAKAQTEAAIAKLREAEAEYQKALAEATVLRAEGEKALNSAQAEYELAQAELVLAQAETMRLAAEHQAAINAQDLRAKIAAIDLLLAGQADKVKEAELDAKKALLDAQTAALKSAADLDVAVAEQYVVLVGNINTALGKKINQQKKIDDAKIAIEQQKVLLVTAKLDSAKFVDKYIQSTEAAIAEAKLDLKSQEYELLKWNLTDTGLQDLKDALEELVKDTVDARKAVDEELAKAETLAADTVTKYAAKETAKEAKEDAEEDKKDALAAWDAALKVVADKEKALEDYNKLAAPANFTIKKNDEESGYVIGARDNVLGYTVNGKTYQLVDLEKTGANKYELVDSLDFKLTLNVTEDPIGTTYKWTYYVFEETGTAWDTYPSEAVVELEIKYLKDDTTILQKALKDAYKAVENARDSLAIFADSLYDAEKAYNAAVKSEKAAKDDTVVSRAAWEAAQATYIAIPPTPTTPTTTDSIALENAAKNHNWVHPFPAPQTRPFTGTNNSKVRLWELADATLTLATNAYSGAQNGYDDYKDDILRLAIDAVLDAEEDLILKTATLQQKEALALLLKGGKREELTLAIDAAKEAAKAPIAAYSTALTAYQAADAEYLKASGEYNTAITALEGVIDPTTGSLHGAEVALKSAIKNYLNLSTGKEYLEYWIAVGGKPTDLEDIEDGIAAANAEIVRLNTLIAEKEALLAGVLANYAKNDLGTQTVAQIFAAIDTEIARLEAVIAKATRLRDQADQEVKYYEAALDTFIKSLEGE
jgi:hypothetical protein